MLFCPTPSTERCLAEAFRAVNPDEDPPCPALDPASLLKCLTTPSFRRILVLTDMRLNTTIFPPAMSRDPPVISRNISLEGDQRGPRMMLDCALLADRLHVGAGVSVRVLHLTLANCSIGSEKPLTFLRFDQSSTLIINSTLVLQPNTLCLPHNQQASMLAQEPRLAAATPAGTPQSFSIGRQAAWCAASPNTCAPTASASTVNARGNVDGDRSAPVGVDPTSSAADNNSYSKLPPIPLEYASRTGLGPAYAATLDQPARTAFYSHPT